MGSKCVPVAAAASQDVDRTPNEFARSMGYGERRYASQAEFFRVHGAAWIAELHDALEELLDRERAVLSIGSGECEHEIPFVQEGYDVVASDLVDSSAETRRLFPELRFEQLDVLRPIRLGPFDDVLMTGLEFYFSDEELSQILENVRGVLRPHGRLIFVLRYRDNFATSLIDGVGIPVSCAMLKVASAIGLIHTRWQMKRHGYRRSVREIADIAARHRFRIGRVRHAGFGVELMRLYLHSVAPPIYALARALDRRAHILNNAVVFEFLT
jgi:SAM-dependent methyltransferase